MEKNNERMQLLNVILTGGQIHDSKPVFDLFDDVELVGKTLLADKAYSSEKIRVFIAEHGAFACIPNKANYRIKHDFNSGLYKQRKKSRAVFSANQELPSRCHAIRQIGCLL
ncbi:MAG: transposase [Selenomonadaceae bacterium]|nr:transposase [Selenomonadaceae bacterium]